MGTHRQVAVDERSRGQRGASLVEFALVAPLLFALVFGIIDFGVALNDWIAVRQGAREATRQAVTGHLGDDESCTVHHGGTAPNASVHRLICLAKDRADIPAERVRVMLDIEGSYAEKRSLRVCLMAELDSITGFYDFVLEDRAVETGVQMKVEQTTQEASGDSTTPDLEDYAETALPGTTWSCTAASTS